MISVQQVIRGATESHYYYVGEANRENKNTPEERGSKWKGQENVQQNAQKQWYTKQFIKNLIFQQSSNFFSDF